jgi:hypothetical protein
MSDDTLPPGAQAISLARQIHRDEGAKDGQTPQARFDLLMLRVGQSLRRLPPCSLVTVRVVTDRHGLPLAWFVEKTNKGEGPLVSTGKHALDILSE